ncbi:MAG TPA: UDP-3-O-(3-hydroxymyristoyl)glucosamine N-acyltransferase [Steroidobacteraceae bacterium]|nr:UDP-3-O-(3-hydroxymyristoyl)glucosamine N-acyltransferase [Steroidobacteraceae bacterium]
MQGEISLGELAVRFGLRLRGDPDLKIDRVATLANAGPGTLSFLANPHYRRQLETSRATAVVVSEAHVDACRGAALIDANPYLAYARIAQLLYPSDGPEPGRHPSAVVSARAAVADSASIGPLCVIEDGAEIGERAWLGPGCLVLKGARLGADSRLVAGVTLCADVTLGVRCLVHPGVVVGADGFGFAPDAGTWAKVPQVGSVRIGDDVEIGANTTIDRGAIDDTVVEDGVKLDNQIQVGHNVTIGAHTAVAGCVGISGSTTIGRRCMIGGAVGIAGHLTIADDVVVTGCSLVSASIKQAGSYSSGMPAVETRKWRRMVARLRRLDTKE